MTFKSEKEKELADKFSTSVDKAKTDIRIWRKLLDDLKVVQLIDTYNTKFGSDYEPEHF